MEELTLLGDLVLIVAIAIPVVAGAQRLKVPSVVGFLATGVLIGPHALALIRDVAAVQHLAEIGVVLLLFAIGLELSLARVVAMGSTIFRGGAIQVAGTLLLIAVVALLFEVAIATAVVLGALAALSSTAIVLKVYKDRDALDTPHGRVVVGILIFQDLAIVPLVLLVQVLGGSESGSAVVTRVAVSLGVVGGMVLAGRFVVPWVLQQLIDLKNRELFTLGIMFFGLGAAFLTAQFGLSLALGAFLAGLVISESEYGIQALSDVLPFRDTFSGIFFISVGMLLDVGGLASNPGPILLAALAVILLKSAVATGASLTLGRSLQVSLMAGLALAQVGEFSFVLASVAEPLGFLSPAENQLFLGAAVLTMLATPVLVTVARPVAERVCRLTGRPTMPVALDPSDEAAEMHDHVIVVGYGVNGRNVARVLDGVGIQYVILEQIGRVVQRARAELQPILFGDATQAHTLQQVGVDRARVIVFAISSPSDERRGVAVARQLNPGIRIVVRTRYVHAIDELQGVGADEVIAEEFETSLEIFSRVLGHYDTPTNVIEREVAAARDEHYGMARKRETAEYRLDALANLGIHRGIEIVQVETGARAVGENPTTLRLRSETGATVVTAVRDGAAHFDPDPDFRFRPGDSVVLAGDDEALGQARLAFVSR